MTGDQVVAVLVGGQAAALAAALIGAGVSVLGLSIAQRWLHAAAKAS